MPRHFTVWERLTRWFADTFCGQYLREVEATGRNSGYKDGQHITYAKFAPDHRGYWPWPDEGHVPHLLGASWGVSSDSSGVYLVHEGFRVAKFNDLKTAKFVCWKIEPAAEDQDVPTAHPAGGTA